MISIVVPVYNAEKYIEETIDSVLAQTRDDWELLLVDDCSKDNSVAVIKSYDDPRIKLISLPHNMGAAEARNAGLRAAKGRFIAYLDADDIWMPDKLENQIRFMEKYDASFVFSSYAFGDENAIPNGRIARVPKTLSYKKALSRTIIFTSTVLIDTEKIDKNLLVMPKIASEDSATWWQILKTGVVAYGLDQPLVIYRRPAVSLSSNKGKAVKRIWNLYRNYIGLSLFSSCVCLFLWAWRATMRRIIDDTFRRHMETFKRFTVIQMSLLGLVVNCGMYAYTWYYKYYPIINSIRISQDGYIFGAGIKLYFRGHLLMIAVYFLILLFCSRSSDSMRTGFVKPVSAFTAQAGAIAVTNLITYFQISIMRNWVVTPWPMGRLFLVQIVFSFIWAFAADGIYRHVFPARETLLIGDSVKDTLRIKDIFDERSDRYHIMKTMQPSEGTGNIEKECLRWYGCIVLGDIPLFQKRHLMEFCYKHYIRVYILPDISDLLVQGSWQMDLFGTTVLEIKEYSINWEQRIVKRLMDVCISSVGLVLSFPIVIVKVLLGNRIVSELCVGKNGKTFDRYMFFREGFGQKIPSLLNVLKGNMSMVGTFAYTVEKMEELIHENDAYGYIQRVKPGYTGYSIQRCEEYSTYKDVLLMDMYYIQNYSLVLDTKLLFQAWGKNVMKIHNNPVVEDSEENDVKEYRLKG